jgi:hypothetical protein
MHVRQISIFLENRVGRLHEVTGVLAGAGINIRALSLADTSDFGILRLIVDRPEEAQRILKERGFTVRESQVIAAEVEDQPGGLYRLLGLFQQAGISVEYMYAFVERRTDRAVMIFRVEADARAIQTLRDAGVSLLSEDEICAL